MKIYHKFTFEKNVLGRGSPRAHRSRSLVGSIDGSLSEMRWGFYGIKDRP